ncbi:MAG TPA: hypothetical protein VNH17_12505 [Streptosporangiaceae bacterium]|nr:hypothetical protein [Streptosporangiaceae bacterium]
MPRVPSPVTSPPSPPGQPYNAAAPGGDDEQCEPGTIYDETGENEDAAGGGPWVKTPDGGAADFQTGRVTGAGWPGNGASSAGPWKNV